MQAGEAMTKRDQTRAKGHDGAPTMAEKTLVAIERDNALRNAVIDAALDCIIMMVRNNDINN